MQNRYRKSDAVIAAALALLTLFLSLGMLDGGHQWSDDFAAYMLEARAIVEGRVKEQTELNLMLHPSRLDYGGSKVEGSLVYVWGLPMLLSVVYRLVGYDMPAGTHLIFYKLPGVLLLAAAAAIAYLFFRRRFCRSVSAALAAVLCMGREILSESNCVQTDIPCMALSLLALLLIEVFLEQRSAGRRVLAGLALGAAMWFTCELRLNGKTVAAVIALAHVLALLRERPKGREWLVQLVPWVTMAVLGWVTRIYLPEATSNDAHIAGGPNWWILHNILAYDNEMKNWIVQMLPAGMPLAGYVRFVLYALVLAGMVTHGLRENLHLTALTIGTFAVLYLLPYFQGIRYLYNVLPLLLLFAAYGGSYLVHVLANHLAAQRAVRAVSGVLLALAVLGTAQNTAHSEVQHFQSGGMNRRYDAYSDEMTDMFAYIYENTQEDAVIAFFKPRLLYLNTGRMGFAPDVGGHAFSEADYALLPSAPDYDYMREEIQPELWSRMELVYDNGSYELYQLAAEPTVEEEKIGL